MLNNKRNEDIKTFCMSEKQTKSNSNVHKDTETIFLDTGVGKGYTTIKQRIDQRLLELGRKWADVYNILGMNKADASRIRNGITIPPKWKRIQIAKALGIDSSVIWDTPVLIQANEFSSLNPKEEPEQKQSSGLKSLPNHSLPTKVGLGGDLK